MRNSREKGRVCCKVAGKETECWLFKKLHTDSFLKEAPTYISAPCRMFDVILGTTSGLNFAKIDLLV